MHNERLEEFKICNGVILLIFKRNGTIIPF